MWNCPRVHVYWLIDWGYLQFIHVIYYLYMWFIRSWAEAQSKRKETSQRGVILGIRISFCEEPAKGMFQSYFEGTFLLPSLSMCHSSIFCSPCYVFFSLCTLLLPFYFIFLFLCVYMYTYICICISLMFLFIFLNVIFNSSSVVISEYLTFLSVDLCSLFLSFEEQDSLL